MQNLPDLRLIKITQPNDFWALYDAALDDDSDPCHNRCILFDAYLAGILYSLSANNDADVSKYSKWYCKNSREIGLMPCLCIVQQQQCDILWVHSRARRMGLGKKLVELLQIKYVEAVLPESVGFWKKCGITKDIHGNDVV